MFQKTFRLYESHPARFVGFKVSCGTDGFPNDWYAPVHLFIYPRISVFSSDVNHGKPVMVTGVYFSEDQAEFFSHHELLSKILNRELKRYKKEELPKLRDKSRHTDRGYKTHIIRLLWFRFFRSIPRDLSTLDDNVILQVLNSQFREIKMMLWTQVVLDTRVKSVAELDKTLVHHFKLVLAAVQDFCVGTFDLTLTGDFDREKSEAVRRKSIFEKYYELKHTIVPRDLFLIRSVYIE